MASSLQRTAILLTLLVSLAGGGFAQSVFETYLESEEEIEEAYDRGELTYEQYQDLRDLYFNPIDPRDGDLSRLEIVPGATESDFDRIVEIYDQEYDPEQIRDSISKDFDLRRYLPFITTKTPSRKGLDLQAYWQTNIDLAEKTAQPPEDKSRFQCRAKLRPHYEILLQGEKRYLHGMEVSKRYMKLLSWGLAREIVLGNFTAGYGNGLNLGKYDYWRYNTDSYQEEGDILIPNSTWYNGVKLSLLKGRLHPDILYSHYEGDSLKRNLVGADLTYKTDLFSPGVTYSLDLTQNEEGNELRNECLSIHGRLPGKRTEVRGEAALLNWDYGALDLRILFREENLSSELCLWGYSDRFINFHASSRSNPDYFTVYFEEVGYGFRCPQAGEIGFSSSNKFQIADRLQGRVILSGWHNRARKTNNHDLQLGLRARLSKRFWVRFDQFIKGRHNPEEPYEGYTSQIEAASYQFERFPTQAKVSYNLKDYDDAGGRSYAYLWIRVGMLSLKPLEIFARIKYVYQELKYSTKRYCEFYLEENLDFWEGFALSAKYHANYRGLVAENKEIRVRLQALW